VVGVLVVGFVAGVIAGISPCILPVLPVVLVAGAAGPGAVPPAERVPETEDSAAPASERGTFGRSEHIFRRRRAVAVVAGLVVSFSIVTLAGSALLTALDLPQDLLHNLGIVALGLLGAGLLVPSLGQLLERPFTRLQGHQPTGRTSGFVLGLALGTVFVPCAGPVLAAISVIGATHHVSTWGVLLTVAFAAGAALPLLVVALAGSQLVERTRSLRRSSVGIRRIGGIVLIAMALAIGFNWTDGLQRYLPGYTTALQQHVEGTDYARSQLAALTGNGTGTLGDCNGETVLKRCGAAPAFRGITQWLNTPGDRPLSLADLRGKVVLVDFWTYSCINCQRSLPHVEAWYRRYRADGFEVVGVHTPEFSFEHVVANVDAAVHQFGIRYPVAIDNNYKTWNAYSNEYWPAEYLIDAAGQVRHVHFGEGGYGNTESLIRALLRVADPDLQLPPRTDVPDRTPTEPTNPETYLGYERLQYLDGATPIENVPTVYHFPTSLSPAGLGLSGTWTIGPQAATAGSQARLELDFQAKDVYLVLGGRGTLTVSGNGVSRTISVGGVPRLYALVSSASLQKGVLTLDASPGIQAYDFTFG
jgi:cytochrome c biogenesis protein CcdA/thiol-disulfide isomerase/thioredoxin